MSTKPTRYTAECTEDLHCPACGHEIYYLDHNGLVSYWGDDNPAVIDCEECGARYECKEHVARSWDVTLTALPSPTVEA